MLITIGDATKEAMACLTIKEYPFSPEELSQKFRTIIKTCSAAFKVEKNVKIEEKAKEVILAYKHLKNLATSFMVGKDEKKAAEKRFYEDEDLFTLWDTCPICHGSGKSRATSTTPTKCNECDPLPKSSMIINMFLGWGFGARDPELRSSGIKTLWCKNCNKDPITGEPTGEFTQRSGRTVTCYTCKGTKIFRKVRCRKCRGTGLLFIEISTSHDCSHCKGVGKVEINPWSPVIHKGAVLI